MIVQPVPVGQASPVRRLLRIAGAVIPPALLVAVIGLGLTGARPDETAASPVPPAAAVLDPAGSSPSPGSSIPGRVRAVDDPVDPGVITWVVADLEGRALLSGELPILDGRGGG